MRTKIQKSGDGLCVKIPQSFAKKTGIDSGSDVELSIRHGDLVVHPVRRKTYRTKDLLRQITSKNIHAEVEFGDPAGTELW